MKMLLVYGLELQFRISSSHLLEGIFGSISENINQAQ